MGPHEQLLVWSDDVGLIDDGPPDPASEHAPLLVADSWLVRDNRVRALELHRDRFAFGCAETGCVPAATLSRFWAAVVERLPRDGEWFPRVELASVPAGRLALRIRPAPSRTAQVRVWVPDLPDPRRLPRRKGPDLGVLLNLRQRAVEAGADEALLRTPDGFLLEGATSSLLWWEDDALCMPSTQLPTLPGITSRLIQHRASELGIEVRQVRRRLESLHTREAWLVNALHGIRPVSAWIGADVQPGLELHSAAWRTWLDDLPAPLVGAPGVAAMMRGE